MIPSLPLASLKVIGGHLEPSKGLDLMNLKPGQVLNAKVLDASSPNQVQLLVDGQKLTVSTPLPLARGMDLSLAVVRSQDGIVLKPVPDARSASVSIDTAGSALNTGQNTAFQAASLTKIFQGLTALSQTREPALNDILMGLSLKSDVRDDQFLPRILKNMGLGFEKKLAEGFDGVSDKKTIAYAIKQLAGQDLKAASLSLAVMESDPGKANVLKQISDALDHFAQLNVKSGDGGQSHEGTRFLLPFPVWQEDGFDFGQLMVDTGKAGKTNKGKKMLSISLLLNMTVLGPLRADFSILDKTIAGRFLLENQATCDYLSPKISDLRQRLSGIGYQAGNIDCQVARPEQISPTSLMRSMKALDDIQGLNIVV